MSAHTPGKARYKVEHCDTRNIWAPLHRGFLRSYSSALAKKQSFCRILVDYLGNGVWEEIESFPKSNAAWGNEKKLAMQAVDATYDQEYMEDGRAAVAIAKATGGAV